MVVLMILQALATPVAAPTSPVATAADSSTWSVEGELLYTNVAGNTELSLLTTGLDLKRGSRDDYELQLGGIVRYGRSEGDVSVENYAGAALVRFVPTRTVSPYVAVNFTRDPVKNLRVRWAARAGAEVSFMPARPNRRVALGLALLRDYESRLLPPGSTEPAEVTRTRFNTTFRLKLPLREGVTLESLSSYEPAARDFGDYLIVSRTSLRVTLTRVIGLQTNFSFERDNTPPPGVLHKNDRTLGVGLILAFK